MNLQRFIKKCLTDWPAAIRSLKLVLRSYYGRIFWRLNPDKPIICHLSTGGKLYLEPNQSFTRCFWPAVDYYEPDVREALKLLLRPGDTFIDCGANIGYFSVLANDLVGYSGQVISIEANPITFSYLSKNLKNNDFGIPINCALTSHPGPVKLFVPEEGDVYSSLREGGLVNGSGVQAFEVEGQTLDDLVESLELCRVDVIKIDIEGGELDVLRSSPHVLSKFRPIVIAEYGMNTWPAFDATAKELQTLAQYYQYDLRLFDVKDCKTTETTENTWQQDYANVILIPTERIKEIK